MQYYGRKQKSFMHSFTWVGYILLAMGILFLGIALVMQIIPMTPESITVYSNGVRQPSTEQTVRTFRLIFLLAFGITGLGLSIAGGIVVARKAVRNRRNRRLKEEGVRVTAEVVDYASSNVHINHRSLERLRCAYQGRDGRTYIFLSGHLRMDPVPYLHQGQVNVYHDHDDISRYFVDVDGSAGFGDRVVEL